MRIDGIEIFRAGMPLASPFTTSFAHQDCIETVLVKLSSGDRYGWGESAPGQSPGYSAECARSTFVIVRDFLAPLLLGQDLQSGEELQRRLAGVKGNHFAKGCLDLAWWDLHSRSTGQPLWEALGGKRTSVDVGAAFGITETVDALLESIDSAVQAGFKRVKLKYGHGWELDVLRAVREAFPDTVLHVDCNSAYTLADADMLCRLDEFNLAMIEQPLMDDDLVDHATLQRRLRTPICLDESITSLARARKAKEIGACGWINIKPGRVGGLTNAIAIHDYCRSVGIPCWVGGMLESSLGASHCAALATLDNFVYPNDVCPADRFYENDLAVPPLVLSGPSRIDVSDAPGCGAEPDPERLQALMLEHAVLRAG